MFAGETLDGQSNDPPRLLLSVIFRPFNDRLRNLTGLHFGFIADDPKKLIPRIVRAQGGDFDERLLVLRDQPLRRFLLVAEIRFKLMDGGLLLLKLFFVLEQRLKLPVEQ